MRVTIMFISLRILEGLSSLFTCSGYGFPTRLVKGTCVYLNEKITCGIWMALGGLGNKYTQNYE